MENQNEEHTCRLTEQEFRESFRLLADDVERILKKKKQTPCRRCEQDFKELTAYLELNKGKVNYVP